MGYLHCCGGLRKCRTFSLKPFQDYIFCELDYLEECPVCGNTHLQLTKLNKDNKISTYCLKNKKAKKFFEKMKPNIVCEKKYKISNFQGGKGRFYLYYNEYGKKKRCYSNLNTMKLGKL